MTELRARTLSPVEEHWGLGAERRPKEPKSRRRRWAVHVMAALLILLMIPVGIGAWWALRKPTISRNFAAEYNAPVLAAKPEELAWPEIRRAMLALPELPEELWVKDHVEKTGWMDTKPGDELWPVVREYVEACGPQLQRIREASKRHMLGYVLTDGDDEEWKRDAARRSRESFDEAGVRRGTENPPLCLIVQPHLGPLRRCARMLRLEARLSAERGESDQVVEGVRAILNLRRLSAQSGGLLAPMLSVAVESLAARITIECVEVAATELSDKQLAELASLFADADESRELQTALRFERAMMLDALQRSFTDDGAGNGRITLDGIELWTEDILNGGHSTPGNERLGIADYLLWASGTSGRAEQLARYDAIVSSGMADARVPIWQFDGQGTRTSALMRPMAQQLGGVSVLPACVMAPNLNMVYVSQERVRAENGAARSVLALHRFKLASGRWPGTLEELVPTYLSEVSIDRFDGGPLRYKLIDSQPMIYSIGTNRVDDGGLGAPGEQDGGEFVTPSKLKADPRFLPGRDSAWDEIYFPPSRSQRSHRAVAEEDADEPTDSESE